MNKNALTAIIGLSVIVLIGYLYFQNTVREDYPGENKYRLANKYLEEGQYEKALDIFEEAISLNPEHKAMCLGKGLALMKLQRLQESEQSFDRTLTIDASFATAYANRGILHDMMGQYQKAIEDYQKALTLRSDLAEGPGWLWRFLHNASDRPPTIADRAKYLEAEMKKPGAERVLQVPEIDSQQRMYTK